MISDDAIGDSKAAYNSSNESDCGLCYLCPDGLHFHPFCKLVNGDDQILIPPHCSAEVSHDVKSPNREGPGQWNCLQSLSWLMNVLGMELESFTGLHDIFRICHGRGPIKSLPHCFPGQRTRGNVVRTQPLMNVRCATKKNPILSAEVQFPIYQGVHLGPSGNALCTLVIVREVAMMQIFQSLFGPGWPGDPSCEYGAPPGSLSLHGYSFSFYSFLGRVLNVRPGLD